MLTHNKERIIYGESEYDFYGCSREDSYYSQKNNKFFKRFGQRIVGPSSVCNTTSIIEGFDLAGWADLFPKGKYKQPEDNLTEFILGEYGMKLYEARYPSYYKMLMEGMKKAITPNEIHDILSDCSNVWIGCKVTSFNMKFTMEDLIDNIKKGIPVVVSGRFSSARRTINHIVTVVGGYFKPDTDELEYIVYDDPFGSIYEDWSDSSSGKNVVTKTNEFWGQLKDTNSNKFKWAHTFTLNA